MDTNLKIIELVKRRPELYTRSNDFPGRAHQWKQVADILKTDVSLVKSRWHLLRARFMAEYSSVLKGNRTSFKYLTEMSFLSNHINLNAFEMYSKENEQYRTEPEFNITKKDLEDASDNDSTSEFIELELGDESHRELAQIPFGASEEVIQNEYVEPIYIEEYSNASQPQEDEEMSPNNNQQQQQVEMFIEVSASGSASAAPEPEPVITPSAASEDNKSSIVKEDTKDNSVDKNDTETNEHELEATSKSQTACLRTKSEEKPTIILEEPISGLRTENYRCEDTIFGELVTATLRQMHNDKKKAVKREIMNLLFT